MKTILGVLALFLMTNPAGIPAQNQDEQAVLSPIHALFDGMAKRDANAIKVPFLAGARFVLMRDGRPAQMSFEEFAERVGKPNPKRIEERIHDPFIRVDHDLAVVWAPFEFLADGKVDHCGTDLFDLVRVDGAWRIAHVTDTGSNDCSVEH